MTGPVTQPEAEASFVGAQTTKEEQANGKTFSSMLDGVPSVKRAAADQIDRVRSEPPAPRQVTLAGAALLALTGSVLTAIYVRKRAAARARKFAWLAFRAGAASTLSSPRRIAPFGGAGLSLLLGGLIVARRRRAQAATPMDTAQDTLAALQERLEKYRVPHQPHLGDVLLGVALGMGAANMRRRRTRT